MKSGARYVKDRLRDGRKVPIQKLITMSREEFYGRNVHMNYATAWAFTHLLVESKDRTLKQLWFDYFFALRDGADQEEVNREVLGKVNLVRLQEMLEKYVERLK